MTPVMQELVLGVIQGLGEFLPISSSAHLVLIPRYFHWTDPGLAFDVALHLGTLAGAVFFFRKELLRLALAVLRPGDAALSPDRRMTVLLILATIPAAVAGLLRTRRGATISSRSCWSTRRRRCFAHPSLSRGRSSRWEWRWAARISSERGRSL